MELKISEFTHADAGQMNMYLNYYNENEGHTGDNTPIGIIFMLWQKCGIGKICNNGFAAASICFKVFNQFAE